MCVQCNVNSLRTTRGALALGRLIGFFLARQWSPTRMMLVNFVGGFIALIVMLACYNIIVVLWIGAAVFGLFEGSFYPTGVCVCARVLDALCFDFRFLRFSGVPCVCALFSSSALPLFCLVTHGSLNWISVYMFSLYSFVLLFVAFNTFSCFVFPFRCLFSMLFCFSSSSFVCLSVSRCGHASIFRLFAAWV